MNADLPETLQEAITYFADADRALEFVKAIRWPDGDVKCPWCRVCDSHFMASRRIWKCRNCRRQFSVKVGTIFEDSPLKLETWLPAVWLIVNAKNGISSCELARGLNVTQKTAWFMLQRIRLAMQQGTGLLSGTVEVDESFIGGKGRKMNAKQKAARKNQGHGWVNMSAVQGLLQRGEKGKKGKASQIVARKVETVKSGELQGNIRRYVLKGAVVNTDEHRGYNGIEDEYTREVIKHAECYARGNVHTNGMENFWSLLKRTIGGTYVSVEPFHLFRYLDEQTFRFNERRHEDGDRGRFLKAMLGIIGKRLTWAKLTAENDGLPA